MSRIGVFICHCGINIASTVDVKQTAKEIREHPDVVYSKDYQYMCSEPGQRLLRDSIEKRELDGVVVAACSPAMHEKTFRGSAASVGMNHFFGHVSQSRSPTKGSLLVFAHVDDVADLGQLLSARRLVVVDDLVHGVFVYAKKVGQHEL